MVEPLKVVIVGAFPFPSHQGSQVYVRGVAEGLVSRGHDVCVAAYGYGHGRWPDGVAKLPQGSVRLPGSLKSGPHWSKALWDLKLLRGLVRWIQTHAVDVFYCHHVEAPVLVRLAQEICGTQIPVMYTPHTSLEEELPVYFPERLSPWLEKMGGAADRFITPLAQGHIGLSKRGVAQLKAQGADAPVVIPPGVWPQELAGGDGDRARERWGLDERPWVVYTGNTDPYQDLPLLLKAMGQIPDAGLLIVTGDTEDSVAPQLEAAEVSRDQVRVLSTRAFQDTVDVLAMATVAAIPRRVCAGFPIKLLNMLAAGVPVVVSKGSAQPIQGVLSVEGTSEAFAGALRSALSRPDQMKRLGETAKRDVAGGWSWSVRASQLEKRLRAIM